MTKPPQRRETRQVPQLYADRIDPPPVDRAPLAQTERASTAVPDICPTPRWCSERGPCRPNGCRYEGDKDWRDRPRTEFG